MTPDEACPVPFEPLERGVARLFQMGFLELHVPHYSFVNVGTSLCETRFLSARKEFVCMLP